MCGSVKCICIYCIASKEVISISRLVNLWAHCQIKMHQFVQSSPALSDLWRINILAGSQVRQSPVLQVVLCGHTHLCTRGTGLEICRTAIGSAALYSVLNHSRALVTWLLTGSDQQLLSTVNRERCHELAHNSNWEHYNSCHWKHYIWRDTLLLWKSFCYSYLRSLWVLTRQWKHVQCCHGYTVSSRSQCLHSYKINIWQYPIHVYPTRSCPGNNSCTTAVRQVLFHVCRSGCGHTSVDYCMQRCMFKSQLKFVYLLNQLSGHFSC